MSDKIARIRELSRIIDDTEVELFELIGEASQPQKRRGRPRKEKGDQGAAQGDEPKLV